MKFLKKGFPIFLALTLASIFAMSFATKNNEVSPTVTNSELTANSNNTCCPDKWTRLSISSSDPAIKWDINGDNYVCFKGTWIGGGTTPQGNGNDPLFDESNVKDNNNPCDE
ncbi:hypothetical protein [Aureispira anguillae]|uniref:Uncharacterized protein n=1 Tax=Aureispira anguillae TaxID=2864201 RepID=A0A916DSY3_9BACT|nr:hypothetical protein [Aureispira anguillae]BDS12834.1 hypothetical protein AsAng_0035590 [Aureispira anguillae]